MLYIENIVLEDIYFPEKLFTIHHPLPSPLETFKKFLPCVFTVLVVKVLSFNYKITVEYLYCGHIGIEMFWWFSAVM